MSKKENAARGVRPNNLGKSKKKNKQKSNSFSILVGKTLTCFIIIPPTF